MSHNENQIVTQLTTSSMVNSADVWGSGELHGRCVLLRATGFVVSVDINVRAIQEAAEEIPT